MQNFSDDEFIYPYKGGFFDLRKLKLLGNGVILPNGYYAALNPDLVLKLKMLNWGYEINNSSFVVDVDAVDSSFSNSNITLIEKEVSEIFDVNDFPYVDKQSINLAGESKIFNNSDSLNENIVKVDKNFFSVTLKKNKKKMSNDILRSGIFAAKKRELGKSQIVERKKIGSIGGSQIFLTGLELDQQDYRVYEQLIQEYREEGTTITKNFGDLLRMVGYEDTKLYRKSLLETLNRLSKCRIEIRTKTYEYKGGLINRININKKSSIEFTIELGKELAVMFSRDNWTQLDVGERSRLARNDLASWIYNYAMTHKNMYPIKLETLRELSGNVNKQQKKFNAKLKAAVELINNELGEFGWKCRLDKKILKINRVKINSDSSRISLY